MLFQHVYEKKHARALFSSLSVFSHCHAFLVMLVRCFSCSLRSFANSIKSGTSEFPTQPVFHFLDGFSNSSFSIAYWYSSRQSISFLGSGVRKNRHFLRWASLRIPRRCMSFHDRVFSGSQVATIRCAFNLLKPYSSRALQASVAYPFP